LGVTPEEAVIIINNNEDNYLKYISHFNIGIEPVKKYNPSVLRTIAVSEYDVLLHSVDINLSTPFCQNRLLKNLDHARMLNANWIEQDMGDWVLGNAYLGSHQLEPELSIPSAEITASQVKKIKNASGIEFLIENPPIYLSSGECDMWEFIFHVAKLSSSDIVIDVGHMIGAFINSEKIPYIPDSSWGGWEKVKELHFSGYDIIWRHGLKCWVDNHTAVFNSTLLDFGKKILENIPNELYITLEMDGAAEEVIEHNILEIINILKSLNRFEQC